MSYLWAHCWPVPLGRDRLLAQWLPLLAECPLTVRTYEEGALLRDRAAVHSLYRILHTLTEFTITLETALVKGVDLWPLADKHRVQPLLCILLQECWWWVQKFIFPSAGKGSTFRHLRKCDFILKKGQWTRWSHWQFELQTYCLVHWCKCLIYCICFRK